MVKVDEIPMRYLELLHFEVMGLKNILEKIAIKSCELEDYVIDEDVRRYYLHKYLEIHKEYESLKSCIMEEYVPIDKKNMLVNFNFEKLCLEFTEKGTCAC